MFRVLACTSSWAWALSRTARQATTKALSKLICFSDAWLSCRLLQTRASFRLYGVHARMLEVHGFFVAKPFEPTEPWPGLNEVKLDLSTLVSALVVAANAHASARPCGL